MDTISYISEMLSEPDILYFIVEKVPGDSLKFFEIKQKVGELREFMKSSKFRLLPEDKKEALIASVRLTAHELGNFMSEIVRCVFSSSGCHDNLVKDWEKTRDLIMGMVVRYLIIGMVEDTNYSERTECQLEWYYIQKVKNIIQMLSEPALIEFLSENFRGAANDLISIKQDVEKIPEFMKSTTFKELGGVIKWALHMTVQETADGVRDLITKIVECAFRRQSSSFGAHDLVKDWEKTRDLIIGMVEATNNSERTEWDQWEWYYIQEVKNIIQVLSEPALGEFLSENCCDDVNYLDSIKQDVEKIPEFMKSTTFREALGWEKRALNKKVQETADGVRDLITKIVKRASRRQSSSSGEHDLVKNWEETRSLISDMLKAKNNCIDTLYSFQDGPPQIDETDHHIRWVLPINRDLVKNTEKFLLEIADSSNYPIFDPLMRQALLSMKAFPEWDMNFDDLHNKLDNLPQVIGEACEGQPFALLLIGGLLSLKPTGGFYSLKPTAYDIWNRVKDDLVKIKVSRTDFHADILLPPAPPPDNEMWDMDTGDQMWDIFTYCYDDVSYFLQRCFLYFACYPIDYEIPATSLTEIWIAEGLVIPEEGETIEETANKYLEELVQRSLVFVSKRSFLGTIKSCRLHCPTHKFVIKRSYVEGFLVANPDQKEIESQFRIAIHQHNKNQYKEVKNNHIHSFLAFNYDRNVLQSAVLLRVLALRNSAMPITPLQNMIKLRYLGLRGSNISELPQNIGDMKNLQTLDVRDTSIKIIPESLWNIKKLRHVYVRSSPPNKGPPSAANISELQILKTVAIPESWVENIPHFLIHLRKLALSNRENIDWKSVSNLLSHMDKLISIAIMGKSIIPSEYVDIRAFPNLETVRSIKLEGIWSCRKLFIDNVKFPPNLTKLTLAKSGLKEDPMPTLGRLKALKFLCLQDGAYIGNQMVCFEGGFPELQVLKLKKLESLENWEVKEGAMSRLTTLRVVQCGKLNHPSNLRVTITDMDD